MEQAYELIKLINEKTEYNITKEMYSTGLFPWKETAESKIVNLIICWYLVFVGKLTDLLLQLT